MRKRRGVVVVAVLLANIGASIAGCGADDADAVSPSADASAANGDGSASPDDGAAGRDVGNTSCTGDACADAATPVDAESDAKADVDAATCKPLSPDGGPPIICGETCPIDAGTADLGYNHEKGPLSIRGTVTLSRSIAKGTSAIVGILFPQSGSHRYYSLNGYGSGSAPHDGTTFSYAVDGLASGDYQIAILITPLDEQGLGGFNGGTTDHPIINTLDAPIIRLENRSACGVDFGIGPIVCLAKVGESCQVDQDCRGTVCQCQGAPEFPNRIGSCDATKHCALLTAEQCASPCASHTATANREATCFGQP